VHSKAKMLTLEVLNLVQCYVFKTCCSRYCSIFV